MQHPLARLSTVKRPVKLLKAARIGAANYRRERHLASLLAGKRSWTDQQVFDAVADDEAALNELRRTGDANYSVNRHVKLMIAMLCEARKLMTPRIVE